MSFPDAGRSTRRDWSTTNNTDRIIADGEGMELGYGMPGRTFKMIVFFKGVFGTVQVRMSYRT